MDTSKMSPEEEREIRFDAWKTQVEGEISDALSIAESAISALSSPKDFMSAISLCRIALSSFDKSEHLRAALCDAVAVRSFKTSK